MNRGEVWWLEHPGVGRRPACILTRQEAIPVLSRVLVALGTTHIRGIPTELELGPSDGMPRACVLSVDSVRPVSKSLLTERITTLSPNQMAQLCERLRFATAC